MLVANKLVIPVVATLPTSPVPVDGQICYYQTSAMATAGIIWVFRYNSTEPTYKWETVGGSAWGSSVATSESTSTVKYVALTTAGPIVTVPLAGEYDVELTALIASPANTSNSAWMSFDIGATGAVDANGITINSTTTAAEKAHLTRRSRVTVATAATALTAKYGITGGLNPATFEVRRMTVMPVRVI